MSDRSHLFLLLASLLITVGVRSALLVVMPAPFAGDPDAYAAIAVTIADSGVFGLTSADGDASPTAFRPPLYPWVTSWAVSGAQISVVRMGFIHVLLAVLTSYCIFEAVVRLTRTSVSGSNPASAKLGFFAALIVTFDPILLQQSAQVMTEVMATALAAAVIYAWVLLSDSIEHETSISRVVRSGSVVGACLALAYLCRPTFVVWALLLCLAVIPAARSVKGWAVSIAMGSLVLLTVIGWTLRNQRAVGDPIWATSHGGYTLLLANNESFYDYLQGSHWGKTWDATSFLNAYQHRYEGDPREEAFWRAEWQPFDPGQQATESDLRNDSDAEVTEKSDDRLCYESAVATIRRRPRVFAWSMIVRASRFWSPVPHAVGARSTSALIAVGVFYLVLFCACGVALYRHRGKLFRRAWWSGWLLALSLTAIHSVYWSNMRMRAPVAPAIAMVAVMVLMPREQERD